LKYSQDFFADFWVEPIVINKPIVLENIYYDFDKWNIRPDAAIELDKLVRILKDNPTIEIEMGSHTDVRGNDQYNLVLSDKRAHAAVQYLISQGIDSSRLTYKGYGEKVLVNQCKNGVQCTEEEHQQNRRTEFKVTKIRQQ
jgi:outer membrane protein OmpA-like peptidoglycan-associated protein